MLVSGDEMGRTQKGNNNVYCQDNELAWLNWELQEANADLLTFTRQLIQFRADHPVFRRRKWFQGQPIYGSDVIDLGWFNPDGEEVDEEQWQEGFAKAIAVFINGDAIPARGKQGERIVDDSFLLLFNAHHEPLTFQLPKTLQESIWCVVLDTTKPTLIEHGSRYSGSEILEVESRSTVLLQRL